MKLVLFKVYLTVEDHYGVVNRTNLISRETWVQMLPRSSSHLTLSQRFQSPPNLSIELSAGGSVWHHCSILNFDRNISSRGFLSIFRESLLIWKYFGQCKCKFVLFFSSFHYTLAHILQAFRRVYWSLGSLCFTYLRVDLLKIIADFLHGGNANSQEVRVLDWAYS